MHSEQFHKIIWPLAIAETIVWAALYYSFPALLVQWEHEFGWSKTGVTGAFTLAVLTSAAMAPIAGRLIDRGLGRTVFAGSALLGALLLVALTQITQLWQFYLVWFGIGGDACRMPLRTVFRHIDPHPGTPGTARHHHCLPGGRTGWHRVVSGCLLSVRMAGVARCRAGVCRSDHAGRGAYDVVRRKPRGTVRRCEFRAHEPQRERADAHCPQSRLLGTGSGVRHGVTGTPA